MMSIPVIEKLDMEYQKEEDVKYFIFEKHKATLKRLI